MPLITGIARQRGGVVAITLDGGEEPCLLPIEEIIEQSLHEGSHIDTATWDAVRGRGRQRLAVRRALERLARRQCTEAELRVWLDRHFDDAEVAHAVGRVRELGYLNDEAWANSYVASPRSQARGTTLLKQELRHHGVPGDLVARVLEERDDLAAALAAARRRLVALGRLDEERLRRRLYEFLRRRGFDHGIAQLVVSRLVAS